MKPIRLAYREQNNHLEPLICCSHDIRPPVPACMGLSVILFLIFCSTCEIHQGLTEHLDQACQVIGRARETFP